MVETTAQNLKIAILYNPFDMNSVERHEIVYNPEFTLADYMGDLAEEVAWTIGYKDKAYERPEWSTIKPLPGEGFSVVRVPEGGGGSGGKDIMRMVAMIAIAVVAFYVVGPWAAGYFAAGSAAATAAAAVAAATFTAAGMMLVNAVLPPAGLKKQKAESNSYGIDGPKNTAAEGIVVPITYGKYRIAGNVVDLYTKNVGDDQYLFMRTVLNDGKVHSVSDILINDQPLENWTNVETRIQLGDEDGEPNDWFGESIRMVNKSIKLTTDWTTHTTTSDVDRLRLDLLYPTGLCFRKDDGRILTADSKLAIEYKLHAAADDTWQPLGQGYEQDFLSMTSGYGPIPGYGVDAGEVAVGQVVSRVFGDGTDSDTLLVNGVTFAGDYSFVDVPNPATGDLHGSVAATSPQGAGRLTLRALAMLTPVGDGLHASYHLRVGYREVGTSAWTYIGDDQGDVEKTQSNTAWDTFPMVYRTYEVRVEPNKQYEVTAFGGTLTGATALITQATNGLTLSRARVETFRYTYESGALPRGTYDVRIKRLTVEEDETSKRHDQVYLSDVAEIDLDNIQYIGTANLSLKIKLSDQLSAIPSLSALVEGSLVNIYDEEGNVVEAETFTQWPAWHALDIMLNTDRGRGISPSRIDFPSFVEWARFCELNDIQFNAVFDEDSNVWDATQTICRVGHASMMRVGTKYSIIIDQPSDPTMLFNDANMIEGTFETTWLPLSDRANEIHYTFFDETDGYKQQMIRVIDPEAQNSGAALKIAEITQIGVTRLSQAQFDVEKQLRENRLLKKTVSFEAPLEAIGLTLGDVAAIQHNSANYGQGIGTGRLKPGSTASHLVLDAAVQMVDATAYRALVLHAALKRYTVNIESVVGDKVYISGLPDGEVDRCVRLVQGDQDTRINNILSGSPFDRLLVENTAGLQPGPAELWDTDVLEERDVVWSADTSTLDLTTPLSGVPQDYSVWMVGPVQSVKQLYRLRNISGNDIYRRKLTFIDYNPDVYLPLGSPISTTPRPSSQVPHVTGLNFTWPPIDSTTTTVKAVLSWTPGDASTYGGADVYQNKDGNGWTLIRSVQDAISIEVELRVGDDVQYKVVAFDKNQRRAPILTAPVTGSLIDPALPPLDAPDDLRVSIDTFKVDATIKLTWLASTSPGEITYRASYLKLTDAEYAAWLEGTWQPEAHPLDDRWTTIGTTTDTSIALTNQDVSVLALRVRAEQGRAGSSWVAAVLNVNAPDLPNQITGLRLNGGPANVASSSFDTADANWTWDDIMSQATGSAEHAAYNFLDYRVRILDEDFNQIRVEYTKTPSYSYTYAKNAEDAALATPPLPPRRKFIIEVVIRGLQGQISAPRTMEAVNAAPAVPTGVDAIGTLNSMDVYWDECTEKDYVATHVWIGTASNFVPTIANRVFVGKATRCTVSIDLEGDHYVRVGHADAFGGDPVNISDPVSVFVPYIAVEQLKEISQIGSDVGGMLGPINDALDQASLAGLQVLVKTADDREKAILEGKAQGDIIKTVEEKADDSYTKVGIIGLFDLENRTLILDQDNVLLSPTEAVAQRFTSIESDFRGSSGVVQTLARTQANATSAVASTVSKIGALTPDGSGFIINGSTVKITGAGNGTEVLSQAISGIRSDVGNNYGQIADLSETLATNVLSTTNPTSIARRVTVVEGSVGGQAASITTLQDIVVNGKNGVAALTARYGVSLDVNGHVTGFVMNNDGASGDFTIVANRFAIVDPASPANRKAPFVYSGGVVRMSNVEVDTLAANSIQTRHIQADNIAETTRSFNDDVVFVSTSQTLIGVHYVWLSGGPMDLDVWINMQNRGGGSVGVRYFATIVGPGLNITTPNWGHYTFDGTNGYYNSTTFKYRADPNGAAGSYTIAIYAVRAGGSGNEQTYNDHCTIVVQDNKTQDNV